MTQFHRYLQSKVADYVIALGSEESAHWQKSIDSHRVQGLSAESRSFHRQSDIRQTIRTALEADSVTVGCGGASHFKRLDNLARHIMKALEDEGFAVVESGGDGAIGQSDT